jgi:hypothetical protein
MEFAEFFEIAESLVLLKSSLPLNFEHGSARPPKFRMENPISRREVPGWYGFHRFSGLKKRFSCNGTLYMKL